MKTNTLLAFILLLSPVSWQGAWAGIRGAYLDPPYPRMPKILNLKGRDSVTPRSDVAALIARQSSVKSQQSRGTCSIFSATALLESLMIIVRGAPSHTDLSEQWLQYLVGRTSYDEGSSSMNNFSLMSTYGMPTEMSMPYRGTSWTTLDDPEAKEICGKVPANIQKPCLVAQGDPRWLTATNAKLMDKESPLYFPEFVKIRAESKTFKTQMIKRASRTYWIANTAAAKNLLAHGIPITLDVDFYYGAWNHGRGPKYGLERNMDHWAKGIIGNPEAGSLDAKVSRANSAGHSILIVGYDDELVVTTVVQMLDGTKKEFKHKGVYIFKNSWGSDNFGREFQYGGQAYPGYGMITQDYAHDQGAFYKLVIK